jgi:Glycosyltransferase family 92/Glycosyl transferase family 2
VSARFRFGAHSVFLGCEDVDWPRDFAYLREFMSPSIEVEEAERPEHGERLLKVALDPVKYERLRSQPRDMATELICYVLDQRSLTARSYESDEGQVVLDDSHQVAYLVDGSPEITIIGARGLGMRRCLMRAVRETIQAALTPRSLILHASAARWGELGVVIAGPKLRGKTSLLIYLLHQGAQYIANDRVVVEANSLECRGLPTLNKLRKSSIQLFPGFRERLDRCGYHSHHTLAEARVSPRPPVRDPEVSPAQLCALTAARMIKSSSLAVVLLPTPDQETAGFQLRRLPRQEAIARLAEVRFGARHPGCVSQVFGDEAASSCVADDIWRECVERVPIVECRMGPFEGWGEAAKFRESLLAVVESRDSESVPNLHAGRDAGATNPARYRESDLVGQASVPAAAGFETASSSPRRPRHADERETRETFPRDVMICAVAKNEGRNLVEWIEHHRLIGVTFFSIYDNESDDDTAAVLAPYVRDGLVELIRWSHHPGQLLAYDDCVERHRTSAKWIAFIDVDEFIVPPPGVMLPSFLDPYEGANGLGINWLMFGPSGHDRRPSRLTVESYLLRADEKHPDNRHIKTIANPRRIVGTGLNPHYFVFADGRSVLDERLEPIPVGAFSRRHRSQLIRINHYFTRSKEEFSAKLARGRATTSVPRRNDTDWDATYGALSVVRDERILADVERLRDQMGEAGAAPATVGVVAIVKGEEPFIDEWLAYHRIIGVEHFYLYDNHPSLPLRGLLERHRDYVTVIDWPGEHEHLPGRNKQTKAYTHSLGRVSQSWVAFIDGDEFIALRKHASLPEFLAEFEDEGAVYLSWHLFGPNGHMSNPEGLITASLTRRREAPGRMGKSIIRTKALHSVKSAHKCNLRRGYSYADANQRPISDAPYLGLTDVAHINHYMCRSFENWMSRLERGEAAFAREDYPRTKEHRWRFERQACEKKFFRVAQEMDDLTDDFMLRYEEPIRTFLERLEGSRGIVASCRT